MVVFDDISDANVWMGIQYAFPNNRNSSKILLTTRDESVGRSWTNSSVIVYKFQPLDEKKAWELFCKIAFQSDSDGHCPPDLEEISRDVVKRCEGLPLAIVALGRLLSTRERHISEWQNLHRSLGFQLQSNPHLTNIRNILLLSYHDLPYYLKPCFLYFGIFPEHCSIGRMRLIRLWIAEGFIQEDRGELTLEQIAEQNLNELVQRNLVQVSKWDEIQRPKAFRVHDLLRELILSKLKSLRFCQVMKTESTIDENVRRLLMHNIVVDNVVGSINCHVRIRTLIFFGVPKISTRFLADNSLGNVRLLKLLDLQDAPLDHVPEEMGTLYHLRYLSLRNTKVKKLPRLHKLRHLLVYCLDENSSPQEYDLMRIKGMKMPKLLLGAVKELQTLVYIEGNDSEVIYHLGNMTQLKKLGIVQLKTENGPGVCKAVMNMQHLESFSCVSVIEEEGFLDLERINLPPPFLKQLYLGGQLRRLPQWICSLNNVVRMVLRWSRLNDDPLQILQILPNLISLSLIAAYMGDELYIGTTGFQKLRVLFLCDLQNLSSLQIERGALPLLENLYIWLCSQMEEVPSGIQHLKNLMTLGFLNMPMEFLENMYPDGGPDHQIIQHVPDVKAIVRDSETGHYRIYNLKTGDSE
ncbi:hypothetical protein Ancab_004615 [Ancistrocladus abbreviatus]